MKLAVLYAGQGASTPAWAKNFTKIPRVPGGV